MAIFAMAKTCQPSATMRCANGDHVIHLGLAIHEFDPSPHCQATHAVANQQRSQSSRQPYPPNSIINLRRIVVNRAKQRLQVHRNKRITLALQALKPRSPDTAIAKKSMYKHHPSASQDFCFWSKSVSNSIRPKGLAPAKNLSSDHSFAPPRCKQMLPGGLGNGIKLVYSPRNDEFNNKN